MRDNLAVKDLYENELYCMEFSNDEIARCLLEPLKNHFGSDSPEIGMYVTNANGEIEEIDISLSEKRVEYVVFDKSDTGFYARFDGIQTSLFFLLNEIMFIDDKAKQHYTAEDIFSSIVYEGTLRDKTHAEMLKMICVIVTLLANAESVEVTSTKDETQFCKDGGYPKHVYKLSITNNSHADSVRIANMLFETNK